MHQRPQSKVHAWTNAIRYMVYAPTPRNAWHVHQHHRIYTIIHMAHAPTPSDAWYMHHTFTNIVRCRLHAPTPLDAWYMHQHHHMHGTCTNTIRCMAQPTPPDAWHMHHHHRPVAFDSAHAPVLLHTIPCNRLAFKHTKAEKSSRTPCLFRAVCPFRLGSSQPFP